MRAANTDIMQSFRYHVVANDGSGKDPLQPDFEEDRAGYEKGAQAGFQSVTLPNLSMEVVEYREGTMKWTQKYPGVPTVGDLVMMRGVTKRDTVFYNMVRKALDGEQYRADVTVYIYQRAEMNQVGSEGSNFRRVECGECFASDVKPNGDLDATSGAPSIGEMTMTIEKFEPKYR